MTAQQYTATIYKWQDWRNAFYERVSQERLYVANNRRHSGLKFDAHAGKLDRQIADVSLLSSEQEHLGWLEGKYNEACFIDSKMKSAHNGTWFQIGGTRYQFTHDDLPQIIEEAEQFMSVNHDIH